MTLCINHKDTSGEAASGTTWTVGPLSKEQLAPGSQSSWSGWTFLQDTHSNCVATLHVLRVHSRKDLVRSSQHTENTHPSLLYDSSPYRILKADYLSKDQELLNYQSFRNIFFLEYSLTYSRTTHAGLQFQHSPKPAHSHPSGLHIDSSV